MPTPVAGVVEDAPVPLENRGDVSASKEPRSLREERWKRGPNGRGSG